jgi:hypothetical protein
MINITGINDAAVIQDLPYLGPEDRGLKQIRNAVNPSFTKLPRA